MAVTITQHPSQPEDGGDVSPRASYAKSTTSTITPGTTMYDRSETNSIAAIDDASSMHSRSRLVRHFSASLASSTAPTHTRGVASSSTAAAIPKGFGKDGQQPQRRRTTIAYASVDIRATRAPPIQQRRKTTSRKAFEAICDVVDLVVPLDVDEGKTSMRHSSLGQLFRLGEDKEEVELTEFRKRAGRAGSEV